MSQSPNTCESVALISNPLLIAVYKKQLKEFKQMLSTGYDINVVENGWTCLLLAVELKHFDIVKEILHNEKTNVDLEINGWTSLMIAAKNGNLKIVKHLVKRNASIDKEMGAWNAIKIASVFNQCIVAMFLLSYKEDISFTSGENECGLIHIASSKGQDEVVKILTKYKSIINKRFMGWTPLMLASYYGHRKTVEILLANGADINLKNNNEYTALLLALQNGHRKVVSVLLSDNLIITDHDDDICYELWAKLHHSGFLKTECTSLSKHYSQSGYCKQFLEAMNKYCVMYIVTEPLHLIRAGIYGCIDMLQECLKNKLMNINLPLNGKTVLMTASEHGHYNFVKHVMSLKPDLNILDENGWNALLFASNNGHLEIVKLLLESGADVNVQDKNGWTACMLAASNGFIDIVHVLVEHGADLTLKQNDGWNALMLAVYYQKNPLSSYELFSFLECHQWDFDLLKHLMIIALHLNHTQLIRIIFYKTGNADFFSGNMTPLMYASLWGKSEAFQLLITQGANINLTNKNGLTALMCAELGGHDDMVRQIKDEKNYANSTNIDKWDEFIAAIHEQDAHVSFLIFDPDSFLPKLFKAIQVAIDLRNYNVFRILYTLYPSHYIHIDGNDHLMVASSNGNHYAVLFLIQIKYDVNKENHLGSTALMLASQNGHLSVAQLLVESNAYLNLKNNLGKTALMLALEKGQVHVVRYLISVGCYVNVIDMEGATALLLATEFGHIDIVDTLIFKKADIDKKNLKGYDALMLAIKYNHSEIVSALLRNNACIDEFRSIEINVKPMSENCNISDSNVSLKDVTDDCQISLRKCYSPLMLAAHLGHAESVQVILEESFKISPDKHKQYVKAKNERGDNALTVALKQGRSRVVKLLFKDNVQYEDKEVWNVFKMLCKYKQYETLETFVKQWICDFNAFNKKGFNVLTLAVKIRDLKAFLILLNLSQCFFCFRELGIFCDFLHESLVLEVNLLELFDRKVSSFISSGNTQFVLEHCHKHIPRTEIKDNKLNLHLINAEGLNALFIAAEDLNFDFMWMLMLYGVEAQLADLYIWLRLIRLVREKSYFLNNEIVQRIETNLAIFIDTAVEYEKSLTIPIVNKVQTFFPSVESSELIIERLFEITLEDYSESVIRAIIENRSFVIMTSYLTSTKAGDFMENFDSIDLFQFYLYQKNILLIMKYITEENQCILSNSLIENNFVELSMYSVRKLRLFDSCTSHFSSAIAYITLKNLNNLSANKKEFVKDLVENKAIELLTDLLEALVKKKVPFFLIKYSVYIICNIAVWEVQQKQAKRSKTVAVVELLKKSIHCKETLLRSNILISTFCAETDDCPTLFSKDIQYILYKMDQKESRKYICLSHDMLRKTLLRLTLNASKKEHVLNITCFKEIIIFLRGDKTENSKAAINCLYHLCSDKTFSIKLIEHKEIVSLLKIFYYHTREVRRLFWRIGSEHGLAFKFGELLSEKLPVKFKINKEPLGKGGFGEVCLVIDKNKTAEKEFVAKVINCMEKTDKDNCKREITILMNIHHKRIITFYGFTESPQSITIYLGYMKMGNLSDFIKSQTRLDEEITLLFTRQILEGVAYIHSKNIIHRDIKGSNILLKTKLSLKLGDFGLSKLSGNNTTSKSADIGTIRFMAPEVIQYDGDVKCIYNNKVDIWSVGCTVVEMTTGKPPNSNCEVQQIVFKFYDRQKPDYILPEGTSQALSEFINKTLEFDPENRPGAQELLNTDQFLTGKTTDVRDSRPRFCNEDLVLKLRKNGIERKCDRFVSLKRFAIENLPQNYQNKTSLLKLIQQIGSLTVLLTFTPDDPNGKTCTGMLCFDDVETYTDDLNKQCTCSDCRGHNRLVLQWAKVKVVTSARMVNEIDIQALEVRVGFDDDDNSNMIIRGLEVLDCDLDTDRCTVTCSWHDLSLLEDYLYVWRNYIRFSSHVRETYRHSREKHKLAVVVSHPFGCSKHVSFGEWREIFKLRQVPCTNSHYTKYSYTTPVLTGCEGAPVLIPGSGIDSCVHLHSYTEKGLNYSDTGVN